MTLFHEPSPLVPIAQLALLGSILCGLVALGVGDYASTRRRNLVAAGMISAAFALTRTVMISYGGWSFGDGLTRLNSEFANSWSPSPGAVDHRLIALLGIVVPAALMSAATWIATREDGEPFLHERIFAALARRLGWDGERLGREPERPDWLRDWLHGAPTETEADPTTSTSPRDG